MELEGKVAIVTGAAVRLGRAQALALAECGARLVVHYNTSSGPADEVVDQVQEIGSKSIAVQADLAHPIEARAIVEKAIAHFGQVDILVNSASIFQPGHWDDTSEENWDRHFDINLKSPFFLSQAFAKQVEPQRRGHIVNLADWRAVSPGTDHFAYTLTKAALVTMTKSLAQALAPQIQVNAIAPGLILPPPGQGSEYLDQHAAQIPLQRTGTADEIAQALLFLLRSDFVTGELLYMTGGEHLLAGRHT